jgi:hypothetical protein
MNEFFLVKNQLLKVVYSKNKEVYDNSHIQGRIQFMLEGTARSVETWTK